MDINETCTIKTRDGADLSVRRLMNGDVAALQAFNAALSPEARRKFLPHAYDDATVAKVLARSENGDDYTLGLFDGGRLAGYFFLWRIRERVPLLGIGLLDEFHHRGLGRQMMQLLIDYAVAQGRDGIELTTMQDNDNAFALYEKCGFRYYDDVENRTGDGTIVVERAMFYAIKPGAQPMEGPHAPPVS
ncbi:MAG: GNAT family N-acetyltransferase [Candidatus Pacebacteria bacterium]|nr:GNAT family N-acetyltransferase [Candidatus Paceibacterota bacterium]